MSKDIKTVGDIFQNRIFRIPDYQRGYAWEDSHRQAFWDDLDLLRRIGKGTHHYTGLIAIEAMGRASTSDLEEDEQWLVGGNHRLCHVVDGQQRLTTLIIFLHELLQRHRALSPQEPGALNATTLRAEVESRYIRTENKLVPGCYGYVFGYAKNPQLDKYFRATILDDASQVTTGAPTSVYARQLLAAKKFFRDRFAQIQNAAILAQWYELVETRLLFNVFEVKDEFDVCLTFEAMNNRGKPLSDLEKLKSRVLYLAGLSAAKVTDPELRKQKLALCRPVINNCWSKVYQLLGWSKSKVLDDDEFLQLAWVLRYGKPGEQRDAHLFREVFTPGAALDGDIWPRIDEFARDLACLAAPWVVVAMPTQADSLHKSGHLTRAFSDETLKWLRRITRLSSASFRPLLVSAVVHYQAGKISEQNLLSLLKRVERYVFVVFGLAEWRSDTGRSVYLLEASKLYREPSKLAEIIDRLESEVKWRYDPERFLAGVRARQDERGEQKGFYGWDYLRYALYEYEVHLSESRFGKNGEKVSWDEFVRQKKLEETVEHIFPQTAHADEWPLFAGLDERTRTLLSHSLGNLLLLSRSKNSSLLNASFASKAREGDTCYAKGSFSEIVVANDHEDWTPSDILKRTGVLLDFIGRRWGVPQWDASRQGVMKLLPDIAAAEPVAEQV